MAEYSDADMLILLEGLRKRGVKSAGFDCFEDGLRINSVEFFPRDLLDVGSLVPSAADSTPTDRPPPLAQDEDNPPNVGPRIPAPIAAILRKPSVS